MSIIYLYIKQHKVTGLLYFGKTTRIYVESYTGSGKYWKRHIKQHGKLIETLCIWEFDNQEECTQFAVKFSQENNIVTSNKWANFIIEDGLSGGYNGTNMLGKKHSEETKNKMSKSAIGRTLSDEIIKKISKTKLHKPRSKESCLKQSNTLKERGIFNCSNEKAVNAWRGKKHTPKTIEKIRQKALQRKN